MRAEARRFGLIDAPDATICVLHFVRRVSLCRRAHADHRRSGSTCVSSRCLDEILRSASIKRPSRLPHAPPRRLSAPERHRQGAAGNRTPRAHAVTSIDQRSPCAPPPAPASTRASASLSSERVLSSPAAEIRDRTFENQSYRASGLNLAVAAIILWNTVYLGRAVDELRSRGEAIPNELVAHIAPLGWEHIAFNGDYVWPDEPLATGFRPLRNPRATLLDAA